MNGKTVVFAHSDELNIAYIPYMSEFTLESHGKAGIEFDFLCVVDESEKENITCKTKAQPYMPQIETKVFENGHITKLTYDTVDKPFYILTNNKNTRERKAVQAVLKMRLLTGFQTATTLMTSRNLLRFFPKKAQRRRIFPQFAY